MTTSTITPETARDWLTEKLAVRLGVPPEQVDADKYFDEFDLDSTEALILAGELEKWLGHEIETTAIWYHPTINELAAFIAEEHASHAGTS